MLFLPGKKLTLVLKSTLWSSLIFKISAYLGANNDVFVSSGGVYVWLSCMTFVCPSANPGQRADRHRVPGSRHRSGVTGLRRRLRTQEDRLRSAHWQAASHPGKTSRSQTEPHAGLPVKDRARASFSLIQFSVLPDKNGLQRKPKFSLGVYKHRILIQFLNSRVPVPQTELFCFSLC